MKLQGSKPKSISRNGSANKRSSADQYNTNTDEYYKNSVGIFDKRDSINSHYSGSGNKSKLEKPLIQRLYDRVVILQNHIDQITNNTQNSEPIIMDFQQKYQLVMSQVPDSKTIEPKETPVPISNEDFSQIEELYGQLQRDMKTKSNNLTSQLNDVHKVIDSIQEQISFSKEQNNIMIQESELQIRETFLQQIAAFDNQLDQDQESFNIQYLDEIEKTIDNKQQENISQMEIIDNFLSQIEEEWDGKIEILQSKIELINQMQRKSEDQMLTKVQAQEWMVAKSFEIQRTVDKQIQDYLEEQIKPLDNKQFEAIKKEILKLQSQVPVNTFCSQSQSKENLPENMPRSSIKSTISTKTSVSTQSQQVNKRKLKSLIVQGLNDLEKFEAFVIESSEVISTRQESIIQESKKGISLSSKKIHEIKAEIDQRFQKCQQTIQNLDVIQSSIKGIKKKLNENDKNVNRVLECNKDDFQNIDVFIDHFDALKTHVQNTHQFLLKQYTQIKEKSFRE